jgi:diacylglycerol kinase family enzyme
VAVFINEKAGSAAGRSQAIEEACARAGLEARLVPVTGPELRKAAESAAAAGETLVAAGGDGTVSTVAGVAVKTGATFGVIPLGTLNHFAKDAGIPLEIDAAVAAIAEGRVAALDTGRLNDRTFVNNASVGFYAHLVRERQAEQRRGHGKWIAFTIGLVRSWRNYRQLTLRMTVDGRPLVRRTPFVFVGNGEYVDEGPALGGRTSLATGSLWIALAPECSRGEMLLLMLRAIAGLATPELKLEEFRACEVTIESGAPGAGLAVDGELVPAAPPFACASRPGSLRALGIGYAATARQEAQ